MTLVVLGDALLDRDVHGSARRLSPDAPTPVLDYEQTVARPGGAALAAALAARDGHRPVTLITALARDDAGGELRDQLERLQVQVVDLGLDGYTPEKIRFFATGHQLLRLDRGSGAGAIGAPTAAARAAIGWADAVLVSDYGRGVAAQSALREALGELPERVAIVWDPHPRGCPPVAGATVATPNRGELEHFTAAFHAADDVVARAQALRDSWQIGAVCVTRGAQGALLIAGDAAPLAVPTTPAPRGDPCGAGDRFAATLAGCLADRRPLDEAAREAATVASAFVAGGGARAALYENALDGPQVGKEDDAVAVAQRVRARGGTVVATGGCFDLLHAGHVSTLAAARALGDCLIVCLNSDASVARLKGPGRPLVPAPDRAAVLSALGCVDAVAVFDQDTPVHVLARLRPHVWAKGGDYDGVALPEAPVLAQWGGRAVVLPYVDGRSTTRLIEEATRSA